MLVSDVQSQFVIRLLRPDSLIRRITVYEISKLKINLRLHSGKAINLCKCECDFTWTYSNARIYIDAKKSPAEVRI